MGRRRTRVEPETAKIGHNSNLNSDEKRKLAGFISEIERLEAEIKVLTGDKSEIYKSARESGFDTAAIRHRIKMRKMDSAKRESFETACDAYAHAMGDFATTELGAAMAPKESAKEPAEAA